MLGRVSDILSSLAFELNDLQALVPRSSPPNTEVVALCASANAGTEEEVVDLRRS